MALAHVGTNAGQPSATPGCAAVRGTKGGAMCRFAKTTVGIREASLVDVRTAQNRRLCVRAIDRMPA